MANTRVRTQLSFGRNTQVNVIYDAGTPCEGCAPPLRPLRPPPSPPAGAEGVAGALAAGGGDGASGSGGVAAAGGAAGLSLRVATARVASSQGRPRAVWATGVPRGGLEGVARAQASAVGGGGESGGEHCDAPRGAAWLSHRVATSPRASSPLWCPLGRCAAAPCGGPCGVVCAVRVVGTGSPAAGCAAWSGRALPPGSSHVAAAEVFLERGEGALGFVQEHESSSRSAACALGLARALGAAGPSGVGPGRLCEPALSGAGGAAAGGASSCSPKSLLRAPAIASEATVRLSSDGSASGAAGAAGVSATSDGGSRSNSPSCWARALRIASSTTLLPSAARSASGEGEPSSAAGALPTCGCWRAGDRSLEPAGCGLGIMQGRGVTGGSGR